MKKKIGVILIIIFLLIIFCLFYHNTGLGTSEKTYKIEFENAKCNSSERIIYSYSDDLSITSMCGEVYYIDKTNNKISLGEAIDREIITINDIIEKLKTLETDGRSTVYAYDKNSKTISDSSFRFEICDKEEGINHQRFLSSKSNNYECVKRKEKDFKLTFENGKCNAKEKIIYTSRDGYNIYSRCGEIYYTDESNDKIPLSIALEKDYITTWDISDKMQLGDVFYDGTEVYEYNKNEKTISDTSFKLEFCATLDGLNDQLFLAINSDNYKFN